MREKKHKPRPEPGALGTGARVLVLVRRPSEEAQTGRIIELEDAKRQGSMISRATDAVVKIGQWTMSGRLLAEMRNCGASGRLSKAQVMALGFLWRAVSVLARVGWRVPLSPCLPNGTPSGGSPRRPRPELFRWERLLNGHRPRRPTR